MFSKVRPLSIPLEVSRLYRGDTQGDWQDHFPSYNEHPTGEKRFLGMYWALKPGFIDKVVALVLEAPIEQASLSLNRDPLVLKKMNET
mmetsp:Transcript_8248/g.16717  ORF Transcript_8248/g.16717 Transcript_8248/m.16717 type:complete len:88 (-) Transcript_8248:1039-1302(-)